MLKMNELNILFEKSIRFLIIVNDNPDPDAIASGVCHGSLHIC